MRYPYLVYDPSVNVHPVFPELTGRPYIADLSYKNDILTEMNERDQRRFQAILESEMGTTHTWGVAGYLERRDTLLRSCPQMVAEQRFFHLGLDVIVPLGARLCAPLPATVIEAGYESGEGNYGGFVLLEHASDHYETFYSFYGHLCRDALPSAGRALAAGEPFAVIGDFHENGNWFHHTHLQILTRRGYEAGYLSKGYCADHDLAEMDALCPSPLPLFQVPGNGVGA